MNLLCISLLCAALGTIEAGAQSAYVGQEQRAIKALSPEQLAGYRAGDGMGFAKTAELNHYPGPRHVLELADELKLSDEQHAATEELFAVMRRTASELGHQLVAAEAALEVAFAKGEINDANLRDALARIERINAELRYTHLQAHLRQREILSAVQIEKYDMLRGYGSGDHSMHDQHH